MIVAVILHRVLDRTDSSSYGALCVLDRTDSHSYGALCVLDGTD